MTTEWRILSVLMSLFIVISDVVPAHEIPQKTNYSPLRCSFQRYRVFVGLFLSAVVGA